VVWNGVDGERGKMWKGSKKNVEQGQWRCEEKRFEQSIEKEGGYGERYQRE
jgi:hypothetical protein